MTTTTKKKTIHNISNRVGMTIRSCFVLLLLLLVGCWNVGALRPYKSSSYTICTLWMWASVCAVSLYQLMLLPLPSHARLQQRKLWFLAFKFWVHKIGECVCNLVILFMELHTKRCKQNKTKKKSIERTLCHALNEIPNESTARSSRSYR